MAGLKREPRPGRSGLPVRPSTRPTFFWIHVQPRASKTEVVGWHGDAIKIRLKAPPVDGAANEELIRFLSQVMGISQQAVQITAGATARRKRIKIDGVDQGHAMAAMGI